MILSLSMMRRPKVSGGGERDRTDGLLRAKQALSQLSYTPNAERCTKNRFGMQGDFVVFGGWKRWGGMGVFGGIMISPLSHLRSLSRLRGRDGEGVSPQFGFSGVSAPLPALSPRGRGRSPPPHNPLSWIKNQSPQRIPWCQRSPML